jgi:hypothetical protein
MNRTLSTLSIRVDDHTDPIRYPPVCEAVDAGRHREMRTAIQCVIAISAVTLDDITCKLEK